MPRREDEQTSEGTLTAYQRRKLRRQQQEGAQAAPDAATGAQPATAGERGERLTTAQRVRQQRDRLQELLASVLPYARRYADGRSSEATGIVNNAVRELQAMGVAVPDLGDGTVFARDAMGREFDHLTPEEAEHGGLPGQHEQDWRTQELRQRGHAILAMTSEEPPLAEAA